MAQNGGGGSVENKIRTGAGTDYKLDVGFGSHVNPKEMIEKSRKTMSTGGGQPIPKGEKRTTQARKLQPRDPETGHFEYNSTAGYSRKYDYHAERNGSHNGKGGGGEYKTVPAMARSLEPAFVDGLKAGDVISASSQKYIVMCDVSPDRLRSMCENVYYDKEGGLHMGNDVAFMRLGPENDRNKGTAILAGHNEAARQAFLANFPHAVKSRVNDFQRGPARLGLVPAYAPSDDWESVRA